MLKKKSYFVELPNHLTIAGYSEINPIGETEARNPRKAVLNILYRQTNNKKFVNHILIGLEDFGGIELFVTEISRNSKNSKNSEIKDLCKRLDKKKDKEPTLF